jgi:hypothetical protein
MLKLSIASILAVMLVGTVSLSGKDIFHQVDSFHTALSNANTNQKLLLTYASSPYSACCKAMDNATFQQPYIQTLLTSSFYPTKINLKNEIGQRWANRFNIVKSPTLLFFDSQGNLIQQIETAVSSNELLIILNQVLFYAENGFWPMEIIRPVVLTYFVPNEISDPISSPPSPLIQSTDNLDESLPKNNESNQVFSILLREISTKDTSAATTLKAVKRKFPSHPISVRLLKGQEASYYQIIIKNLSPFQEAQLLLDSLKESGFEKATILNTPTKPQ